MQSVFLQLEILQQTLTQESAAKQHCLHTVHLNLGNSFIHNNCRRMPYFGRLNSASMQNFPIDQYMVRGKCIWVTAQMK